MLLLKKIYKSVLNGDVSCLSLFFSLENMYVLKTSQSLIYFNLQVVGKVDDGLKAGLANYNKTGGPYGIGVKEAWDTAQQEVNLYEK